MRTFRMGFQIPGVSSLIFVTFCDMFGFYGAYTFLGSFVRSSSHLGSDVAGGLVMAYGIGFAVSPVMGYFTDRFGRRRSLIISRFVGRFNLPSVSGSERSISDSCAPYLGDWAKHCPNDPEYTFNRSVPRTSGNSDGALQFRNQHGSCLGFFDDGTCIYEVWIWISYLDMRGSHTDGSRNTGDFGNSQTKAYLRAI